jgi:hypothetical protein
MHTAALAEDLDPDRLSFICTLRVIRRQVIAQPAFPPEQIAAAIGTAVAELLTVLLPHGGCGPSQGGQAQDAQLPAQPRRPPRLAAADHATRPGRRGPACPAQHKLPKPLTTRHCT